MKAKTGSLANKDYQPGGGDVIIYDEANRNTRMLAEKVRESLAVDEVQYA